MSKVLDLSFNHIPHALLEPQNAVLLTGVLRGVEKESLRVTPEGSIAHSPHPKALGAAMTHPLITTDFSEALLEFITPPTHQIDSLLEGLRVSHQFTYQHIGNEALWPASMPCAVGNDADIPVAYYGESNRGKMKTTYRVGLGHRYGRTMQTVAGLHYNFSLPQSFWAFLHQHEKSIDDLGDYTTKRYFDLIRNFRRYYWLLIYLFGASPAICRSFVKGRPHTLEQLNNDQHTLHLPYATSLRMGDLGYQSAAQEALYVCYNGSKSYVQSLIKAISEVYPPYEKIGTFDANNHPWQLNTSLLQIENEFYSPIRPKRTALAGETALSALCRRGVEYIEVRCLDLDPFEPLGLHKTQIHFLDTFLLFCLFQDSPESGGDEYKRILRNQKKVVHQGRDPEILLDINAQKSMRLRDWADQLMIALTPFAQALDTAHNSSYHSQALERQSQKVADASLTPSAKILQELQTGNIPYARWTNDLAQQYKQQFATQQPTEEQQKWLDDMAIESLKLQEQEEQQDSDDFGEYLTNYYRQYKDCCKETS